MVSGEDPGEVRRRAFIEFVGVVEPRLRRALVGAYGPDRGRDAAAAALAFAWSHWDRVVSMQHPVAYLYRVGQSETRPRRRRVLHDPVGGVEPLVEPRLRDALATLSLRQRTAVVLVHGFDWPIDEVADVLGTAPNTARTHLKRGLDKLRDELEVTDVG